MSIKLTNAEQQALDDFILAATNDRYFYERLAVESRRRAGTKIRKDTVTYALSDPSVDKDVRKLRMTLSDRMSLRSVSERCVLIVDALNKHYGLVTQPTLNTEPETNTEEEPMSKKTIEVITYVNGKDVNAMSKDELMEAIKKVEVYRESLTTVKTKSKYISQQVAELDETLIKLAAFLDA